MIGIGIESSCDESGVAVVQDGHKVIAAPLYSQIAMHAEYGGIVPEYASRAHLEKFPGLIQEAIKALPEPPNYIAVTVKPGLAGSLLVGYNCALALADYYKVPLVPVHHLEAHFAAVLLSGHQMPYPALGLLVSGGNTSIFHLNAPGNIEKIADTLDDAIGEALDKAASMLNLPYPGGPSIEKAGAEYLAKASDAQLTELENYLPDILKETRSDDLRFSFSGIKTSLLYALRKNRIETGAAAYIFQKKSVEHIVRNVRRALKMTGQKVMIAAGGVMANSLLRAELKKTCDKLGVQLLIPEKKYCTDNGAMIAAAGWLSVTNNAVPVQRYVSADNTFDFSEFRK